ncbi:hypothetical protein LARI1_G004233 [Lachnellula arida]|uniref:Uncharacterized protein n=1 Tax=Lachnellula arida TaxID=1316785 RepID=A0A8T9BCY2_9HELO|nr:hypothetical protein LARI1_G004233 [Lachnellula arida]
MRDNAHICLLKSTDSYTNAWLPVGEGGCENAIGDIAITRINQYIAICPGAFSFAQMVTPRTTIGTDASIDWSGAQHNGNYAQSLEYWATPLSYTIFHELCHYLLNYEDYFLNTEVTWIGGTTNKAYKYNGATQLVAENPGDVENNVDNLGIASNHYDGPSPAQQHVIRTPRNPPSGHHQGHKSTTTQPPAPKPRRCIDCHARERVQNAEAAERDADRALIQARAAVKEARAHVKKIEQEAAEEARLARIKQEQASSISKRAQPLGRHNHV